MDSNLNITDGVYEILSETDVREQRAALGQKINPGETIDNETLVPLLERFFAELKKNSATKRFVAHFEGQKLWAR